MQPAPPGRGAKQRGAAHSAGPLQIMHHWACLPACLPACVRACILRDRLVNECSRHATAGTICLPVCQPLHQHVLHHGSPKRHGAGGGLERRGGSAAERTWSGGSVFSCRLKRLLTPPSTPKQSNRAKQGVQSRCRTGWITLLRRPRPPQGAAPARLLLPRPLPAEPPEPGAGHRPVDMPSLLWPPAAWWVLRAPVQHPPGCCPLPICWSAYAQWLLELQRSAGAQLSGVGSGRSTQNTVPPLCAPLEVSERQGLRGGRGNKVALARKHED